MVCLLSKLRRALDTSVYFSFYQKKFFPSLLTAVGPVCMKLILPGPWYIGVHITETFPDGAYVDSSLEKPRTQ